MKRTIITFFCVVLLGLSTFANATLIDNGKGFIYDTDLNITWYDYSYYGPANTGVTWQQAMDWASSQTFGGVSGWRLPKADTTCSGYNCTNSEFGHLYYEEFGLTKDTQLTSSNSHPFTSLLNGYLEGLVNYYWTSTEYQYDARLAYDFAFNSQGTAGVQAADWKDWYKEYYHALAVHEGKVGAVPIPGAVWLLGSGLIGLVGLRKRIQK